jgi:hypothetical protein
MKYHYYDAILLQNKKFLNFKFWYFSIIFYKKLTNFVISKWTSVVMILFYFKVQKKSPNFGIFLSFSIKISKNDQFYKIKSIL